MKSVVMSILVSLVSVGMISVGHGDEYERQTFTVTFDLGAFGYAYGPLSQEVEYGKSATAPEFFCDPSYDFVEWDKDFSCVTSDMVIHAAYELSSVYKMIEKYSGGYGADGAFVLDCIYYDVESHCIRAQGTLDDSYNYSMFYHIDNPDAGSGGSEHDGNLRMRIFCVDEQGNETDVTCDASSWSCALPVDIDAVSYVGIELVSTWYSGEYCWFWMDASCIERVRFNVLKIDMSEFDPSEYTYYRTIDRGSYYDRIKDEYHYYRQHEYDRSVEGIKPLTVMEIVNASNMSVCINDVWAYGLDSMSYILKSSPLEQRSNVITIDKTETLVGTTITGYGARPAYYHETRGYSTFIVVDPEQYTARFDLCGHGERIGGGELMQNIDCLRGEEEVFPEVRPNPHYVFRKWTRSHWEGNTLVYVAEYDREYVIAYEDTKGVYNPNPTNYMAMVTNEIAFAALADTDEYWFKGWEPAKIEFGTTGDLVVTAKWDRVQGVAEAAGDQSREWVSSGDVDWFVTWNDEKGQYVVRSGEIGHNQISVLETVVINGGTVSFDVKVSCEGIQRGQRTDGLSILVDGAEKLWLDGEVGWTNVTIAVTGEGEHRIKWKYSKDVEGAAGDDCAYLANFKFYHQVVVSFDGGGATVGEVPSDIVSYNGGTITLPEVGIMKKINHSFAGWSDGIEVYQPGEKFVLGDVPPTFTAVWSRKELESPVIDIPARYETERTTVAITAVEGATIRYTVDGSDPLENGLVYRGPFEVAGSLTVRAVAVRDDWFDSAVVKASTVRAPWGYAECLNSEDVGFMSGGGSAWVRDLLVSHDGTASVRSGKICNNETNWLEATVIGAGTLSFWWKASAEMWRQQFVDFGTLWIDGVEQLGVKIGNHDDWRQELIAIKGGTRHTIRWVYSKDVEDAVPFEWEDCIWLDEVMWHPALPSVADDAGATVTGDAESGFVIKPSAANMAVEVTIPQDVDAAKVTVEVSPKVERVTANGAKVKILNGSADITEFLDVPAADADGVVDLTKATVKEEIVKEAIDVENGATVKLNATEPIIMTTPTKPGLVYTFREGTTLEGLGAKTPVATKIGDGEKWTLPISVRGGKSAFYLIGVGK